MMHVRRASRHCDVFANDNEVNAWHFPGQQGRPTYRARLWANSGIHRTKLPKMQVKLRRLSTKRMNQTADKY